ncbi:hypothetical protein MRB53_006579 [Persea americana]|uniref:Uncharacterized protein n=1 Tax=Persea americana TaxID=3435 RepID=A0ACC2MGD0_PERAE|nr:hypothetical protein MRB53_006579 [Persea americana]
MASPGLIALNAVGSVNRSISSDFNHFKNPFSTIAKPILKELQRIRLKMDASTAIKKASQKMFDAFVDSAFEFVDQTMNPFQSNFAPVEEIGEAVKITSIEGEIPNDFPEGIYIRNGPNPLFGALQSTVSMFGRSSYTWIEGEGMLHAVYFTKDTQGNWMVTYQNRYVESETFKIEKERNRPSFLPAIEGESPSILAAYFLNKLRFGKVNKYISNTSVFQHSGKFYTIAENHLPHEFDISSLKTLDTWDVNGAWDRPFTSHPKRAPRSGELVIMGVDAKKPYFVLGVISADGKKLTHKVDLKFKRCSLCHDLGVTEKYNVIMDCPLIIDVDRLIRGGPLIKYEKKRDARIGVMPRYGDANSVKWFNVKPHCTFHIINCFEDGGEVVVRGCRSLESIIPGPDMGHNKFEWFSRGFKPNVVSEENVDHSTEDGFFFSRSYEWRLNMETGAVSEKNLTGTDFSMDFPMINEGFTGLRSKYGYTQVVDLMASSSCGLPKYGSLAKLYFEELEYSIPKRNMDSGVPIKVEYYQLEQNQFCSGASFVPKHGGFEEDDGWIISFTHNEDTNISQVHIIDSKKFDQGTVATIMLPQRVPYGFHGTFIPKPSQN